MAKSKERPSLLSWLMGFSGILITTFSIFFLSFISRAFYQLSAISSLKHSIVEGQERKARILFNRVLNPPVFLNWGAASSSSSMSENRRLQTLLALVGPLSRSDCTTALAISENLSIETNELPNFKQNLISCAIVGKTIAQNEQDLSGITKYLDDFSKESQASAQRFGDLLTLAPVTAQRELGVLEIYSSGVLSGLPKLQGLPDGISTLTDLKKQLGDLGAQVQINAPNPFEVFRTRLEELRRETSSLLNERTKAQEKMSALKIEISKLKARHKTLVSVLLSDLSRIFEGRSMLLVNPDVLSLKQRLDLFVLTI